MTHQETQDRLDKEVGPYCYLRKGGVYLSGDFLMADLKRIISIIEEARNDDSN